MKPFTLSTELLARTLRKIPLTAALQVELHHYDGDELVLAAPLAPNVNDKGCAFGGSLASLLTLAGWGLILLKLEAAGIDCDIYVQDSNIRYLAPLWGDLRAHAAVAAEEVPWSTFLATLTARGRARIRIACRTPTDAGDDACTLDARFVAILREPLATR